MSEHPLEKLLGGFAADTLTPEERQKLFTAALQDQQLFNILADEQALKDLLADPAVRRRLLQTLNRTGASGAGGSLSWLDWFRRPAGLALAGGLAVAALAVVLGPKVYQEGLRHEARSVAIEDIKPAAQPAPAPAAGEPTPSQTGEPQAETKENATPSAPQGRHASDVTHENAMPKTKEYEGREQTKSLSARALFYGRESAHPDSGMMAQEQQRETQPLAESAPRTGRLEPKTDGLALKEEVGRPVAAVKPLGLRYSFIVRGTDGREREADAVTAVKRTGSVRLTVEANQDSYLQIWKTGVASTPQLLFPAKESGQLSLKIPAGQRQDIPLPLESEAISVRLSRVPFGPITRQEAALFDRSSPDQLEEAVRPSGSTGPREEANYVVNRNPSAAELLVAVQLLK
jgi:hypothetical protein